MPSVADVEFRFSTPADDEAIRALLASAGLPSEDVRTGDQDYLVAISRGRIVGSVGLEKHGEVGLLRSFAVVPELRGRGLGQRLHDRILEHCALRGVETAYVLTTTAERFCLERGFERVERGSVPEALRATAQFRALCPETAVCLRRRTASGWRLQGAPDCRQGARGNGF